MTTPQAEKRYLEEHQRTWASREPAVYNPRGVDPQKLPAIYGFINGGSCLGVYAALIADDGTMLGGHACSNEAYAPHDLGVLDGSRPDRHETFRSHYPGGYRMKFVPSRDTESHDGLQKAIGLAEKSAQAKSAD